MNAHHFRYPFIAILLSSVVIIASPKGVPVTSGSGDGQSSYCAPAAMSYSSDGSLLVVGITSGKILIFKSDPFSLIQTIDTGFSLSAYSPDFMSTYTGGAVAISSDNRLVGGVAVDQSVGVWSITDKKPLFVNWGDNHGQFKEPEPDSHGARFYPGLTTVAHFLGNDGEVFVMGAEVQDRANFRFYRVEDGMQLKIPFRLPFNANYAPILSPNLAHFISTLGWDPRTGLQYEFSRTLDWVNWQPVKLVKKVTGYEGGFSSESSDKMLITQPSRANISTASDYTIWDASTLQPLFSIPPPGKWNNTPTAFQFVGDEVAYFDNQELVLVAVYTGQSTEVSTWDISSRSKIGEFSLSKSISWRRDHILGVVSPNGAQLAYPDGCYINLVKLPTGELINRISTNP